MGRLRISPKYIRSGAETLTNAVKGLAEKAWGIPVVNGYACTEVGAMAQECRHLNGLHLAEDLSVFEVVDENNRPVNAGTKGAKLLVTTLTNPTLPLIRYEITDLITLADGPCACGMPYARVAEIEGRREEILSFPKKGGGTVTVHAIRLHSPMIGTAGVRQFQFSQLPYGIEVTIAVSSEFRSETVRTDVEHSLRTALDEFGAAPCDVHVKIVDSIRRVGMAAKEKLVAK